MPGKDGDGNRWRRRREDVGWLHQLWRDAVPLLAIGLAAWAVLHVSGKADKADVNATSAKAKANQAAAAAERQKEGRRIAISVLCGFGNGVEEAGKATIAAPIQPAKLRRALERLGLPKGQVRERGQKAAGEAYARLISKSVVQQASGDARAVIRPDGSMNCPALQNVSKTAPLP